VSRLGVAAFFEENREHDDLSGQAVRSGVIALVARGIVAAVQLTTTVILARLLVPADFGLVAIVAALTSFVPMLIDLGLTDSTVQNRTITPQQISALFWISLGVAAIVCTVLIAASPFIAHAYGHTEIGRIAIAWGFTFILYGLSLQHMALLRRAMRFQDIARIEILGSVGGSAVTVTMAFFGFGYWSLVMRPIVTGAITAAGSWWGCPWKPGRPRVDSEVKGMLKFGVNVTGGAVAWIGTNSADRAVMGFMYPPALIGLYQNALMLYENALLGISMPLHKVGVSALSKLRGDDQSFTRKYAEALSTVSFYSMPAFAVLAVIAPDLVAVLLGSKWAAAGPILAIFSLRGIVHVLENSQTWLHMPLGRPDRWIRWAILTGIVQVTAVVAGLPFGVLGVAVAIVIARSALALPAVLYAGRPIGLRAWTIIDATGRQFVGSIAMFAAGMAVLRLLPLETTGSIVRIAVAANISLLVYLSVVVAVFRLKDPMRLALSLGGRFVPARFR
jgi:PST family polysaccharide transporter